MTHLPCTVSRNVRIYDLTAGKTTIEYQELVKHQGHSLKKDLDYKNRSSFIEMFEFPVSSQRIIFTPDEEHILALGTYPPEFRCYDTRQMNMKFFRRTDELANDILTVGNDWRKVAIMREDRQIELHTQGGFLLKTKTPNPCRCMSYNGFSCDLLACGSSHSVWRLNLEQGRFMAPLQTAMREIECCDINPVHYLYGFGGYDGLVELWDPRDRSKAASTVIANPCPGIHVDVTAFAFKQDGVHAAVGLSSGHAQLYDLRSTTPIHTFDHRYGLPISRIGFHKRKGRLVSMDKKVAKIWEPSCELFTTITGEDDLADFALSGDSGLIVFAGEQRRMQAKYIPDLGPAPAWLGWVDTITEEMEQNKDTGTTFASYKFVSREDLELMGLTELMGTKELRPYMHGFFMNLRKYNEAMAIIKPVSNADVRKARIEKRMEKARGNRITKLRHVVKKKKPKINKEYMDLLTRFGATSKKRLKAGQKILKDPRFKALFDNPEFKIGSDEEDMPGGHKPENFRPSRKRSKLDETDSSEEEALGQIVEVEDKR